MALRIPKSLRRIMQQISPPGAKPLASALGRGMGFRPERKEVDVVQNLASEYKQKGFTGLAKTAGKDLARGVGGFAYNLPEIPRGIATEIEERTLDKMKKSPLERYYRKTPQMSLETGKIHPNYEKALKEDISKLKGRSKKHEEAFRDSIVSPEKAENLFAYQLGSGVGSLATSVLLTVATKNPTAASIAFGLQAKSTAYKEARGLGKTPAEASVLSTAAGITEGGLEYVGLQQFMKPSKGVLGIVKKSLIEGSQEGSQQLGSNFWARASGDTKRSMTQDVAMSTLIGAVLGAGAGTVMPMATTDVMKDRLVSEYGLTKEEADLYVDGILPRIANSPAVAKIIDKLSEETGALGEEADYGERMAEARVYDKKLVDKKRKKKKGKKIEKAKYQKITDPVKPDIRDTMQDLGVGEQMKLLYEGLKEYKRKGRPPKATMDYLKGMGIKEDEIITPGITNKIRPARKIFAKLGSDLYHAVYEPFTTAENARGNWVIKRLDEITNIWQGASKSEIKRVGIHAVQRDNLANGRKINDNLGKGVRTKYNISEDNLFELTAREQGYYNEMRNWFNKYQEGQYERIALRPEYFPGLADDSIMRSILTLHPGKGELPSDILSFATKHRKDTKGVNRNIDSVEVMKRYVNSEANDLYYGSMMKPMQNVIKKLRSEGKESAADYVKNYTERMVGFPGKLDRELMTVMERIDKTMGRKADPHRILLASQAIVDLQYMGGLGIKPSTAIRNFAQLLHTASGMEFKWTATGVTEAITHWNYWVKEARKAGVMQKIIPDVTAKGGRKKVQDIMLKLFETTETINRVVTYAAASKKWDAMWSRYGAKGNIDQFVKKANFKAFDKPVVETLNKLIAKGELHKARKRYGREITANTQYLYQKGEAPLITRTQGGKQIWIFQTWWENYLEMWGGWVKHKQWKSIARYLLLMIAAIKFGDELGLDLSSWVGASPIPELGRPERYPVVSAPLVKSAAMAANIPLQGVLAVQRGDPMWTTPEGKKGKLTSAIQQFTKTTPIFAPGGTFGQQMIRIAGEKRQPIEAFLPIHRARSKKEIKAELGKLYDMHRKGTISTSEKYRRANKLKAEMKRREKELPKRRK